MNIHSIGSTTVGDTPRIVAVLCGDTAGCVKLAEAAKVEGADIIEFRADFCTNLIADSKKVSALIKDIKEVSGLPILLTIRQFAEGGYFLGSGHFDGSEVERLKIFTDLMPEVDAVDVEINAEEIRDDVLNLAKSSDKLAILSYHNFKHTPRYGKFQDLIEDAQLYGADMLKIAVMAITKDDVKTLSRFTIEHNKDMLLTSISMGEIGMSSRVINPFLGSCFTYGYVGEKATTSGQLRISDLRKFIDSFTGQRINSFQEAEKIMCAVSEDGPPIFV